MGKKKQDEKKPVEIESVKCTNTSALDAAAVKHFKIIHAFFPLYFFVTRCRRFAITATELFLVLYPFDVIREPLYVPMYNC